MLEDEPRTTPFPSFHPYLLARSTRRNRVSRRQSPALLHLIKRTARCVKYCSSRPFFTSMRRRCTKTRQMKNDDSGADIKIARESRIFLSPFYIVYVRSRVTRTDIHAHTHKWKIDLRFHYMTGVRSIRLCLYHALNKYLPKIYRTHAY